MLKECHREGLLNNERYNNTIPVRVRMPKSGAEAERYTVDNCALEAKFMREKGGNGAKSKKKKQVGQGATELTPDDDSCVEDLHMRLPNSMALTPDDGESAGVHDNANKGSNTNDESDSEDDSDDDVAHKNPFIVNDESDSGSDSDDDVAYQNPFSMNDDSDSDSESE